MFGTSVTNLKAFLRVIGCLVCHVILSAQKAAVGYFSKVHVYQKRNKKSTNSNNSFLVELFAANVGLSLWQSDRFKRYKIRRKTANTHEIIHMRTNSKLRNRRTIGETRKNFCTLSGHNNNVLALDNVNIGK